MNNFIKRLIVALIGIPLAIIIINHGGLFFSVVVIIASTLALWEFYKIAEAKKVYPSKFYGLFFGLILQIVFILSVLKIENFDGFYLFVLTAILFVLGTLIIQLFSNRTGTVLNISTTIFGVFYVSFMFCALIGIREFYHLPIDIYSTIFKDIHVEHSTSDRLKDIWGWFVVSLFFSVWICDTAAYLVGKSIGSHKLFPRVSPNKTWEGSIGGLAGGIAGFAVTAYYLVPELLLVHAIIIGFIVGTIGQIGDLAESQLKRDAGVKDSSGLLPGHGGFLDRFDSVLFVAPSVFIYLFLVSIVSTL